MVSEVFECFLWFSHAITEYYQEILLKLFTNVSLIRVLWNLKLICIERKDGMGPQSGELSQDPGMCTASGI